MYQKRKQLTLGLFSFLLLCTVINFAGGHTGAAICGLGAGIFYLTVSFFAEE